MLSMAVSHHLLLQRTRSIRISDMAPADRISLLCCLPGKKASKYQVAGAWKWEPVAFTGGGNIAKAVVVFMQF